MNQYEGTRRRKRGGAAEQYQGRGGLTTELGRSERHLPEGARDCAARNAMPAPSASSGPGLLLWGLGRHIGGQQRRARFMRRQSAQYRCVKACTARRRRHAASWSREITGYSNGGERRARRKAAAGERCSTGEQRRGGQWQLAVPIKIAFWVALLELRLSFFFSHVGQ
jgi:hypothetical protein